MGEKETKEVEKKEEKSEKQGGNFNRRDFMKLTGFAAAGAGVLSAGGIGAMAGASPYTHTGWEHTRIPEYFDRKPYEIDKPKYNQVGTPRRVDYLTHRFSRFSEFRQVDFDDASTFSDDLRKWYQENPDAKAVDRELIDSVIPQAQITREEAGDKYFLHKAFFDSYRTTRTNPVESKPEVYDWEDVAEKPVEVKDPADMSELVKQVGRIYGSTLVRIARYNPLWSYEQHTGGRGYGRAEKIEIPEWWEYAIVLGVPHEWDQMKANPTFGHSIDAYNEVSIATARLTSFIKSLGYAARPHCPDTGYEVIVPPIMVDAGVGEQGRFGTVITPEFGANFRPAVITTNLPMKPDKPIDIGVREFCEHCKICAETCPSESVSFDSPKEIRGRGFDGWQINIETCHNFWMSLPGSGSCRICLVTCPFSQKSNWLHTTARNIAAKDRTGMAARVLTWGEKVIYGHPDASHFADPNWGTYRQPPWWFDTDRFVKVKK